MDHAALSQLLAIALVVAVVALALAVIPAPKARDGANARGMSSDPRAWRGFMYTNPADPALFVPKRSGVGWTVNFGHRWAWRLVWTMVGSLFATVVLSTLVARD